MSDSNTTTKHYECQLTYSEERLVAGVSFIPCIPVKHSAWSGASYEGYDMLGEIRSGSWVRYITYTQMPNDVVFIHLLLDTTEEVMIPSSFLPYLIKAHRKSAKGRAGMLLRRTY